MLKIDKQILKEDKQKLAKKLNAKILETKELKRVAKELQGKLNELMKVQPEKEEPKEFKEQVDKLEAAVKKYQDQVAELKDHKKKLQAEKERLNGELEKSFKDNNLLDKKIVELEEIVRPPKLMPDAPLESRATKRKRGAWN